MKSFAPCLLVCVIGAVLALSSAVALAVTSPPARGGHARTVTGPKTSKAPPPPMIRREQGHMGVPAFLLPGPGGLGYRKP